MARRRYSSPVRPAGIPYRLLIHIKAGLMGRSHFALRDLGYLRMKMPGAALFLFAALSVSAHAADPATIAKCETCHGLHGDSTSGTVPRLNGQQPDYLHLRLREFLDPTRGTPHATYQMWETATNLGDRIATELSQYFGSQAPTPAAPEGALAAKGAEIYRPVRPVMGPPARGAARLPAWLASTRNI
jgi:cytochrome c553